MKKTIQVFFVLVIVVVSIFYAIYEIQTRVVYDNEEDNQIIEELISDYEENTKNFIVVTVEKLYANLDMEDECLIYVGRVTCEWCRLFVSYLSDYKNQNDIDIFYLDSTDTDINATLKEFREQNDIEYVPALIYYNKENGLKKIEFDITDSEFSSEKLNKIVSNILK